MFSWDFFVLLAIGLGFVISTRAEGESQEVGGEAKRGTENEVDDEKKEEETRKSLQPQQEDKKGETDWATQSYQANTELIARLSVTVAQLEEGMREMEKKTLENELKMKKEINNLHLQLKKDRQNDQKPAGPVAPLEKFLTETGVNVKNNTRRIEALEKGLYNLTFGGNCTIPYDHTLKPLPPYLTTKSAYGIYPVNLGWDAARQACLAHGAELASMETDEENRFVVSVLIKKYPGTQFWIGGSKAGPIVSGLENHKGFKWLTGSSISSNDRAWLRSSAGGKCLWLVTGNGNPPDQSWYDYSCENTYQGVCEFKMKE